MQFYCLRCRNKKNVETFEMGTIKDRMGRDRHTARAVCPDCTCRMCRFTPKGK